MADVKLTVIGKGSEFDGFRALNVILNPFSLRATSTTDMVNKVLKDLDEGDRIIALDIVDHGSKVHQRIGSDALTSSDQTLVPLSRLRTRMAPGAVVTLHGCQVGHAEEMMKKISGKLGNVKVRAGTAYQRAFPGLEGGEKECKETVCQYSGPGFWDWVGW